MRPSIFARALCTVCCLAAFSSQSLAATVSVTGVSFSSGNVSATDPYTTNATATTQTSVAVATPALTQFDATTGVLTGAAVTVTSSRTHTLSGTQASKAAGSGSGMNANFAGNSTANITATGINNTFSSINLATSCSLPGNPARNCTPTTQGPTAVATDATLAVGSADLNSYVGAGTVGTTLTLPQVQSNLTDDNATFNPTAGSSTYTVSWSGNVGVTYTYLLHAAPSFDGGSLTILSLDFGTLYQNDTAGPLGFSLFNPAGDRTGLNLTGITGSGDTSVLDTDLALFNNLLQGDSFAYSALFDTSQIGTYSATYLLGLEDYMPGGAASSTKKSFSLQLNLAGNVQAAPVPSSEPPLATPVPASIWLMLTGLTGIFSFARRSKNRAA